MIEPLFTPAQVLRGLDGLLVLSRLGRAMVHAAAADLWCRVLGRAPARGERDYYRLLHLFVLWCYLHGEATTPTRILDANWQSVCAALGRIGYACAGKREPYADGITGLCERLAERRTP